MNKHIIPILVILLFIVSAVSPMVIGYELDVVLIRQTGIIGGNHPPIIIDGNDDFTSENGVTSGSGTKNDPYIIENWVIAGNGSVRDGIFINNTNVYFVVRNCTVYGFHHPDEFHHGVSFSNVENGYIVSATIYECYTSIRISHSTNISINNCSCYDYPYLNGYGISCHSSSYITIKSCECYNLFDGIHLGNVSDIIVEDTNCYNNQNTGLNSFDVEPTTMRLVIKGCKFYDNEWYGVRLFDREFHPSYSRIINCEFYNNGHMPTQSALLIERLNNNIVENCSFHHNFVGLAITSENNIIRNCSVFNNMRQGITIYGFIGVGFFAKNNKIINCDSYSNRAGIQFLTSVGSVVEKCNIYNNSWFGVENDFFSIVRIKQNNIYDNGYNETFEWPCGLWSMQFSFVDARDNWWGAENGPRMYRYGYLGIIPIRLKGGDKIIRSRSILLFRPWEIEPIPDAGVQ